VGLDIVCFVLRVERTFGVRIPDREAARLATPRHVIDCLHRLLPRAAVANCPTQRTFYAIRRELRVRLGARVLPLRPGTILADVLPPGTGARVWAEVGEALGIRSWPRATARNWLTDLLTTHVVTIGDAVRETSGYLTPALKPAGDSWSWPEIACVVDRIVRDEFAVTGDDLLDARFIDDIGAD
jgi:hypothetical protein